ncbi:MAG TPA: carbon-nitrogen hydrolase family protein [Pseudomonadales bacterium]
MTDTLQVAAIQMVSGADWQANVARARQRVCEAAALGSRLVVLPENFATFMAADLPAVSAAEATAAGPIRQMLATLAAEAGVFLVAGTLPVAAGDGSGKSFAASFVYGPDGTELARYDKIHLFDADVDDAEQRYRESDRYCHGDKVVTVAAGLATIGLSVCYDLRFPELFRQQRRQGANVLVVPSAFTYATGQKHWQVLLQARAIENQCFVIAANQGGWHDARRRTWGHSMIIGPDGELLAGCGEGEAVVSARLDFAMLGRLRSAMPLESHRRLAE